MHPHNSSTAGPGRLTAVPEESTNGFTAVYPPHNLFRDSIRSVAVSGLQVRSTPFHYPQSSHSGSSHSNDSGASRSCPSSHTAGSSAATEFGAHELTKIARQMVKDGYIQRMIQAFEHDHGLDRALKTWFFQLDVDWVLQIHEEHGLHRQLQGDSAPSFQELVDSWIRALAVIVISTQELVHEIPAVALALARFGKASISAMLVFVNIIDNVNKLDKLQAVLHMHICVLSASYDMSTMHLISPESQGIFNEIGSLLDREGNNLNKTIYNTMKEVRALIEDDYLWVIEIPQGKGDVHRNTRLMVDCIMSMVKARAWARHSARNHDPENLGGLIDDSVRYLKDLLLRKSELCSDPSLRYMFLLNNSYLVAQLFEPGRKDRSRLTPEYHKYMDSYLDVSWGHVLSHIRKTVFIKSCLDVSCGALMFCVPKTCFHGWCQCYKNESSLAKFESKFHQIYQAQKFWKVPDPLLRDKLRGAITKRVISGYRDYLKEHPEVKKHLDDGGSSPDILEEMLGELFEG